ncbi:MAG: hypothetical protein Q9161_005366 [Pseudevernia consocians]
MSAPQILVTAEDRGPLVNIVAWVALIAVCLATFIKVAVRLWRTHGLGRDDVYMLGAMTAAVLQTIAVVEHVKYGLGRHMFDLSKPQALYISEFFYIVSICLARMAVLQFLTTIALSKTRSAVTKGIICLNIVWAVVAIVAIALQCRLPRPWEVLSDQCVNQVAFWDAIGAFDIILDVAMVALPIILLHHVKIQGSKKIRIFIAFAARLLVPPLTVPRLFYFTRASHSPDQTYNDFNTSIVSQLTMTLSVIVACIPFSKPVADDVQSGILDNLRTNTMAHSSPKNDSTGHILQALPRTRRRPGDGFRRIADPKGTDNAVTTGKRVGKSLDNVSSR